MTGITAVIITKNEEKNIVDCLETLKWCEQIIVIDDFSEDRTSEIAKLNNIEVYKHELNRDFSKQRNFALSKCKTDWVFFIDADERVSKELKNEIENELKNTGNVNGFFIRRRDILWGIPLDHGETGRAKFLRLARKDAGEWIRKVHEVWEIDGRRKELKNYLIHYPHQSISEILNEINFYTDIRADELKNNKTQISFFQVISYPLGKFILNYFFKLGFLDGIPGIIMANMMSMHSFLTRGKLWLLTKNGQK